MSHLQNFLGALKDDLGIKDTELFYKHLSSLGLTSSLVEFQNMATEKEKPSQNFIDVLLSISDNDQKDVLIKIYCEQIFPKNYQVSSPQGARFLRQKTTAELTEFQISEIAKSKIHYYLFLILVLKGDKVKAAHLKKQFGNLDSIDSIIEDLIAAQVLIRHNGYIYSISPNVKFLPAGNPKTKAFYAQFDEWDKSFSATFNFEKLIEKTIIRRISDRHVPVIQKQLENIFEIIRTSEMSQLARDQEPIVFLQLNFSKGK